VCWRHFAFLRNALSRSACRVVHLGQGLYTRRRGPQNVVRGAVQDLIPVCLFARGILGGGHPRRFARHTREPCLKVRAYNLDLGGWKTKLQSNRNFEDHTDGPSKNSMTGHARYVIKAQHFSIQDSSVMGLKAIKKLPYAMNSRGDVVEQIRGNTKTIVRIGRPSTRHGKTHGNQSRLYFQLLGEGAILVHICCWLFIHRSEAPKARSAFDFAPSTTSAV
jgi:hypothetical protein